MRTFTRVANMSPGLRDTGDEIDAAHINELQQAAEDLQAGALPIALAGIEGALEAWVPTTGTLTEVLERVDSRVFDTRAYDTLEDAFVAAGFRVSPGAVTESSAEILLPGGSISVTSALELYDTWGWRIRGVPNGTYLVPSTDMDCIVGMDGCGYGVIEGLGFRKPSSSTTVQDVIRIDRTIGASNSVHMFRLRDIFIGDMDFVRGVTIGKNSGNYDLASVYLESVQISSSGYAPGETNKWQEGFHLGSSVAGNVLNFNANNIGVTRVRRGIFLDNTNVRITNCSAGYCEYAVYGQVRSYFSLDGFYVEECEGLFSSMGVDNVSRHIEFRNGKYSHYGQTNEDVVEMDRAGNLLFEGIQWYNPEYPAVKAKIKTGGHHQGRTITFRNFTAQETPEEIWWYTSGSGFDRRSTRMIFDGYHVCDGNQGALYSVVGLYPRTITSATDAERKHILPCDGRLTVDTTGGAISPELPYAALQHGRELYITQISANACTITAQAGETVAGGATLVPGSGLTVHLYSDGVNWIQV